MTPIPLLVPSMPRADKILPYLREIDQKRWYTNFGPLNERFEQKIVADIAPGFDRSNIITVSNCTVGLELALQASGARPGARVLVPSLTFVATATAIVRAGMVPVFADVDSDSWCLTPEIATRSIGSVDAVMPVSTFGVAQDATAWDEFVARFDKPVIIDAAGAYGNQGVGKRIDVVFSFHATKAFGIGEGGCVLSPDPARISAVRKLQNFGINTENGLLEGLGTNGKLSEYHCAVGLSAFDEWDAVKAKRRRLMTSYLGALTASCPSLTYQKREPNGAYPLLTVLLPEHSLADAVSAELKSAGIETRRWYCPPLHKHPALSGFPTSGSLTVTDNIGDRIIGLPFHLELSSDDISRVVAAVKSAIHNR